MYNEHINKLPSNNMILYNEPKIAQLMADLGLNRLQAIRHIQSQEFMQSQPNRYPLGRSSYQTEEDYEDWARRHPELAAAHGPSTTYTDWLALNQQEGENADLRFKVAQQRGS